jgi:hypothetical protein
MKSILLGTCAVLSCIVSALVFLSIVMGLPWLLSHRRNITRKLYLTSALKNISSSEVELIKFMAKVVKSEFEQ